MFTRDERLGLSRARGSPARQPFSLVLDLGQLRRLLHGARRLRSIDLALMYFRSGAAGGLVERVPLSKEPS
jgi:hypothetical protein